MPDNSTDPIKAIRIDIDKVLQSLFENAIEGILITDKNSQIVMINARAAEIFGYEKDAMLGMNLEQIIPSKFHGNHRKYVEGFLEAPRKRKKSAENKLFGLTASGKEVHLGISLNPIEINAGLYIVCHIVDKSEIEEINQSLKENENLLSALFQNAADGIITMSSEGILKTINPSAAKLFGYKPEEVIGENINILLLQPHHLEDNTVHENDQKGGKSDIIGLASEVEGKRKDGSLFPLYLSISKIDLHDGHFYAGIVHDLTEQKANEETLKGYSEELERRVEFRTLALAQAIKRLEIEIQERKATTEDLRISKNEAQEALQKERELNELKSRFVTMASHEFRTPLATILSSTNILEKYQDSSFEDKRPKHLARIKSNVRNLTTILNDFLSLSKLEEGEIKVQREKVNIKSLAIEVKEDMDLQTKEGQQINYVHEGVNTSAFLDPRLLQNIFINLLSNAIKYSHEHTAIDFITRLDEEYVSIEIRDQGIGIPEKEMPFLFDRFFRAKNATNIQGTGLGLNIVKQQVELMKGKIEASSLLNKGTTFTLTFPHKAS